MSTTIWQSSDGAWTTAGSWTGGTTPVSNDVVIIPSNNTQAVVTGQDGQAAIDLDNIIIQKGYDQDIGTTGARLVISADKIEHRGGGTLWFTDGNGTTDYVIIDSDNLTDAFDGNGNTVTRLTFLKGKSVWSGTGTVTNLEIGYRNNPAHDAIVTVSAGAGTITNLYQTAGQLTASADITTAYLSGGRFTFDSASDTLTTLIQAGGYFIWKGAGGNTITLAIIMAGTFDALQDFRNKTVTTIRSFLGSRVLVADHVTLSTIAEIGGAGTSIIKSPV